KGAGRGRGVWGAGATRGTGRRAGHISASAPKIFPRHKDWEAILDRIIALRERENMNIRLMIQADMLCHKIPNFIEKAGRAGANRVFVGLESINPANLIAAKKRQNKITEYRANLLAWKKVGAIVTAG